ncbi:hypothetical protein SPF06_19305 [Sinomonas sp. JGH33]|uniref:Lipoprotein n=1 Tax=Sinomonas terricola TaxID=3110330 RepID=A0ABU5TBI6_9MICC|nr:hypothetical protein [Sinomonas sp. JGH33]MEA5456875.1 hypothetical protein [Sinomonas sp. JGH33]
MGQQLGNRQGGFVAVVVFAALAVAGCSPAANGNGSSPSPSAAPSSASSIASASASATPSGSSSATVNAMVPGFPTQLIPIMPGATPLSTSYDASANPQAASLVASTSSTSDQILDFYSKAFTAQGFTAVAKTKVGTTDSQDFVRSGGKETINVAVVVVNGRTTFTVGASVAPGTIK